MRSNVFNGDVLDYTFNGNTFKVCVENVNFSSIKVYFLNKNIHCVFQKSEWDRFSKSNGEKIYVLSSDEVKAQSAMDFRKKNNGEHHSKGKYLIDWVLEVLQATKRAMTYKEIGDIIKSNGYVFPYRENEDKTSIECSIHTRWFERFYNKGIKDIERIIDCDDTVKLVFVGE